jgi:glutaredoxin
LDDKLFLIIQSIMMIRPCGGRSFTALAVVFALAGRLVLLLLPSASPITSFAASTPPPPPRNPNPVIKSLAQGMGVLKPVFGVEAKLQANVLGRNVDRAAVEQEINDEINSQMVVIYTYGISPFSTEALALLDGAMSSDNMPPYKVIELGVEWFLLNGKDSVKRVLLSERVANGATSLPKIFINGQCIGGCAELAALVESGELRELTQPVKKMAASKKEAFANPFAKFFGPQS